MAGGGTAGHVQPALAVARVLAETHGEGSVELVGSRRGLEAELLLDAGMPVSLLAGRGIQRRVAPSTVLANAVAVGGLAWALVRSFVMILARRPAVVVAVGGYASLAPSIAAVALGVPLVVVNVDVVPGAANRILARLARASAVGWPSTCLPRAVVTGAPVRDPIIAARERPIGRAGARRALGLPEGRFLVAVFGGSLGARRINEAVLGLAGIWRARADRAIYHVVGERDWSRVVGPDSEADRGELLYVQVPYEDRMELLYQAADIAVCRAGAMTVAELAVVGLPAVLVPLPGAPGDHQSANARALEAVRAAVVVSDAQCTPTVLAGILDELAEDRSRLDAMGEAAAALGRPDAARAVAALVEEAAGHAGSHVCEGTARLGQEVNP